MTQNQVDKLRYSVNLIKQGETTFYSSSIPSDILANCCYAASKDEDPIDGFQRMLDKSRAADIANYIDTGQGTIPSSIILSAQSEAELKLVGGSKTIEFNNIKTAFLIIDGQHRVYGYKLAKTAFRVPVIIYSGLTKSQEARLFIDVNTKQKPVPKELLLAINRVAERESDVETTLGEIFDIFNEDSKSALLGLLSSTKSKSQHISRVTFNAAIKPLLEVFEDKTTTEIYSVINPYFRAVIDGVEKKAGHHAISNKTLFRAFCGIFKDAALRVKDAHDGHYTTENFSKVIKPIFKKLKPATFEKPGTSINDLIKLLQDTLKTDFKI